MKAMADEYGAAANLEDFERKAQLMDYVSYRRSSKGLRPACGATTAGGCYG